MLILSSENSPKIARPRGVCGYGVASEDLEYETNEEEEDYEEDEDVDDRLSNSSGASSPSYSPSSPPEMSDMTMGMSTKVCDEQAPESHERSTKDLNKLTLTPLAREVDADLCAEETAQDNKTNPRMPTILSLVNKPLPVTVYADSTPKRIFGVVNLVDDDEGNDSDIKIIDKPAGFEFKAQASKLESTPGPVYIDLDHEEETFSDDDSYIVNVCSDEDENIPSDDEEDEDDQMDDGIENFLEEDSDKSKSLERDDLSSSSERSSEESSQPSSPPITKVHSAGWFTHLPSHPQGDLDLIFITMICCFVLYGI